MVPVRYFISPFLYLLGNLFSRFARKQNDFLYLVFSFFINGEQAFSHWSIGIECCKLQILTILLTKTDKRTNEQRKRNKKESKITHG